MPGLPSIDRELVRQLAALGRLGARLEPGAARELIPWGVRSAVRGLRTLAAAQVRPDWSWPLWLEQQMDPRSDSFVAPGELPLAGNVTLRNWTMVGNPGSPWEAVVDPAGLVAPWPQAWSLDWAVRDRGAWRHPRAGTSFRQGLPSPAPIVETVMALAGGDVVHTVHAVAEPEELVVVEIRNDTTEAIDVRLGIRPFDAEGLAVVERVGAAGHALRVDGHRSLLLERTPGRIACSTSAGRDSFAELAPRDGRGRSWARDPAGMAHATLDYAVPKGERVRVAAPLRPPEPRPRRRARSRQPRPARLPEISETRERWTAALDRGLRVQVPDEQLQRAIDANRAQLLVFHDGDGITPGPRTYHRFWFRDAAYMLLALGQWGFEEEVRAVLASYPARQRRDGFFASQAAEWDGNGAALWAIAEHVRLTGGDATASELLPAVRAGARWIARARRRPHRRRSPPEAAGLLPAGMSAEHLGPPGHYYWDAFWSLRGLLDAAWLLDRAGDRAAAQRWEDEAADLRSAIRRSLSSVASRLGSLAIPAGPDRGLDAGLIGSLAACWPLALIESGDPRMQSTVEELRRRFVIGDAFFHGISHAGLGTYLTLHLAQVELRSGDERAWQRLAWMLEAATPTFTWPEAIHPRLGTGCYGDGHHGWAAADFLSCVRSLLVREDDDGGLVLLSVLPAEWRGRPLSISGARTHAGAVSYTLRWESGRAVLRWECERAGTRLRAPALAAAWATTERTGTATFADGREVTE